MSRNLTTVILFLCADRCRTDMSHSWKRNSKPSFKDGFKSLVLINGAQQSCKEGAPPETSLNAQQGTDYTDYF